MRDSVQPIRVLLVEDHEVVRIGLRTVVGQSPRLEVVGETGTVADTLQAMPRLKPDVVLMDIRLPDGSGVDVCRTVVETYPQTRVIALTSFEDEASMMGAVVAGASGYLLKEIAPERLVQAIEMVAEGHSILDQQVIQRVQTWIHQQKPHEALEQKDWGLSPQQYRVLALVAEGKTNKEIAATLELSEKTIRNYLAVIFEKLQITRRTQAAAFFVKQFSES